MAFRTDARDNCKMAAALDSLIVAGRDGYGGGLDFVGLIESGFAEIGEDQEGGDDQPDESAEDDAAPYEYCPDVPSGSTFLY